MGNFSRIIIPSKPNQKEHRTKQHPKHRNSPIRIKLSQTINNKDLPPRILECSLFPVDQKYFIVQLSSLISNYSDYPEQKHQRS